MRLDRNLLARFREVTEALRIEVNFEFKDIHELSTRIGDTTDQSMGYFCAFCISTYEEGRVHFTDRLTTAKAELAKAQQSIEILETQIAKKQRHLAEITAQSVTEQQSLSQHLQHLKTSNEGATVTDSVCYFAFKDALLRSQEAVDIVTGGAYTCDIERLANEPRYVDSVIRERSDAVALKALVYCVAQSVFEYMTQPALIAQYLINTPWVNNDERRSLAQRALVHTTGMDIDIKVHMCALWIAKHKDDAGFVDANSQGYHPNYLTLPSFDFNFEQILSAGRDCEGLGLSPEQVAKFARSLSSRPMLSSDFGYKKLLGITDAVIANQLQANHVTPVFLKEDYSRYLEFMQGDFIGNQPSL